MATKIKYIEAECFLQFLVYLCGYIHLDYNEEHVLSKYSQLNIRYKDSSGARMWVASLTLYRPEGTKEVFFLSNTIRSMMHDIIRFGGYDHKYGKETCAEWIRRIRECLVKSHD